MRTFLGKELIGSTINGNDICTELMQVMNDLRTIRFRRPFTFFKLGILGQRVWTFFPNEFERTLYKRVTNLREVARK